MTEAISPNSSASPAMIDQDNRPQPKNEWIAREFKDLIEQYHQIQRDALNTLMKLAESRQNDQPQLTASDVKASAAFQAILKEKNLPE